MNSKHPPRITKFRRKAPGFSQEVDAEHHRADFDIMEGQRSLVYRQSVRCNEGLIMTTLDQRDVLRSADGITSPVAISRDGNRLLLSLSISPLAPLATWGGKKYSD
jgi:hypothetical protein